MRLYRVQTAILHDASVDQRLIFRSNIKEWSGTTATQYSLDLGNDRQSYDFGRSRTEIESDRRVQAGHDFIGIAVGFCGRASILLRRGS